MNWNSLKKKIFIPNDNTKENILAFRTITTLLSKIQQQSLTSEGDLGPKTEAQRQELSILSALATVIVMDKEVVATVVDHPKGGELGILACQQPTAETSSTLGSSLFRFLINKNPRRDTKVINTGPFLSNPTNPRIPSDLDPAAQSQQLIEYIHKRWWVLCYKLLQYMLISCVTGVGKRLSRTYGI